MLELVSMMPPKWTQEWDKEVWKLTNKRGVDVVFESVGAAVWLKAIRSLRRGGRLVTTGTRGLISDVNTLPFPLFDKVDLSRYAPALYKEKKDDNPSCHDFARMPVCLQLL
jgi:NADPH:quinone reductase-like Zn-dependent oxidoreductase